MVDSVEKLLRDNSLSFTVSGRDYLIKCLNVDHEDTNPSLRVDRVSGLAHCFSCGWKRNLFKHYGATPPITSIKLANLKEKLNDIRLSMSDLEIPEGSVSFKQKFRGISPATLKYFEAFYTESVEVLKDRIVFPIRDVTGKISVFIARHTLSDAQPKYVLYPRHSKVSCYPFKIDNSSRSIILVEGIFDMINLYDKGLRNVVCVFGTQSLKNNIKEKLLVYKTQGIIKVYVLFDGDKAGKTAAAELKPLIEQEDFIVEIMDLPDDVDPGSLDQEEVDRIKEYIK